MVCSFTGHRIIESESRAALVDLLSRAVEYAYGEGCRDFICGGAIGFDTLAAKEIIRFRMTHKDAKLILALPCVEQDAKWSDSQKNAYNFTLSSADEVIYVSDSYTKTCMAERNRYLAERCDILIAYAGRMSSGAGQTLRMAEKLGKRIYNLYQSVRKES